VSYRVSGMLKWRMVNAGASTHFLSPGPEGYADGKVYASVRHSDRVEITELCLAKSKG